MMARSRRRRGRRRGAGLNIVGVLLLLIAVALVGGLIYLRSAHAPETLNQATLCPEGGPTAQMLVIADMTDPVERAQLNAARALIDVRIEATSPGTRISLALISPNPAIRGRIAFSMCKPRSGEDANKLYENPGQIQARYREGFQMPFDAQLAEMLSSPGADSSPIMESIQSAVASAPGFLTFKGPRTIVLFSDLMQHGEMMSFYRGDNWRSFQKSGAAARFAHSLNDATIILLRIPRPRASVPDVDDFWSRYFDAQGVARIEVHSVGDL